MGQATNCFIKTALKFLQLMGVSTVRSLECSEACLVSQFRVTNFLLTGILEGFELMETRQASEAAPVIRGILNDVSPDTIYRAHGVATESGSLVGQRDRRSEEREGRLDG